MDFYEDEKLMEKLKNYRQLMNTDEPYVKEDFHSKTHTYPFFISNKTAIIIAERPRIKLMVNDYQEWYVQLWKNCEKRNIEDNPHEVFDAVKETVGEIFGGFGYDERARQDILLGNFSRLSIRNFAGKNTSACSERAALAHNFFKFLGYESYFVSSPVIINDNLEGHNFNIVRLGQDYYVYDLALGGSKEVNGEVVRTPVVKTLSQHELKALNLDPNKQQELVLENPIDEVTVTTAKGNSYTLNYCTTPHYKKYAR